MHVQCGCRRMQEILSRPGSQRIQDKAVAVIAVRSKIPVYSLLGLRYVAFW